MRLHFRLKLAMLFLLLALLLAGEGRADRNESLLYVGYGALIGGSVITAVHNGVASPSDIWIGAGGLLGVANLPVGGLMVLYAYSEGREAHSGLLALGGMHFILAGANLALSWRSRRKLEERERIRGCGRANLALELSSMHPSVRVALRW